MAKAFFITYKQEDKAMSLLPNDPIMLMSVINTKLRDIYPSLAALCEDMEISEEELCSKLAAAGFRYDETGNRFI